MGDSAYYLQNNGFGVNIGKYSAGQRASYFSLYSNPRFSDDLTGKHLTDRLAQEAVSFIQTNQNNKFFLQFSYYTVHTPLEGKPDLLTYYQGKTPGTNHSNATYAAML